MATYVNDLRLKEIATGDEAGTWGTSTNTNLELIAEAFSFGTEAITTNADTHTTTIADGSTDPGRSIFLKYTGTLDSACTITIGPNTVSKLWLIENATSGSQTIIIKQGSGATITVPNGQTKAIYSDGAGSGGAMVDAFQDLSIPDLFIDDDLTFTSDSAVITFGADGDTTLTHTDGTGLTLNSTNKLTFGDVASFVQQSSDGVLRVDGEATIDLNASTAVTVSNDLKLDSDSAVLGFGADNDTTLTHTDGSGLTLNSTNKIMFNDASQFIQGSSATVLALGATDEIDLTATALDFNGNADVSGTLAVGGVVTANAGVVVDNITIDGTEIDLSSGNLTLDVAGNIVLNADGGQVVFSDGSTQYGNFLMNNSGDLSLHVETADKLFKITGTDGSSGITPLSIDMSAAGAATFNAGATFGGDITANTGSSTTSIRIKNSATGSGSTDGALLQVDSNEFYIWNYENDDVIFGANNTEIMRIDGPTGRVGIGTNSPGGLPLHLKVASGDNKLRMQTANKDAFVMELEDSTGNLKLGTNTTAGALVIADNGNAGIGVVPTFTPGGSRQLLQVTNGANGGQISLSNNASEAENPRIFADADNLGFSTATTGGGTMQFLTGGVERFLLSDEAVINESGADYNFRVESTGLAFMFFVDAGNNAIGIGRQPSSVLIDAQTTSSGTVTALRLRNSGQVANSAVKQVFSLNRDGSDVDFEAAAITVAKQQNWTATASTIDSYMAFNTIDNESSVERMRISNTGVSMGIAAGSGNADMRYDTSNNTVLYDTSSQQFKTNIRDNTTYGLAAVNALQSRIFEYKDGGRTDVGLIAEEVVEVVPELVGLDDEGNPLTVDYKRFVSVLVKAVQEQQSLIETLQAEVAALKGG